MSGANEEAFDESSRELCGDGNCLGIIVDGKCNVCGLTAATSPRDNGSGHPGADAATSPRDNGSGHPGAAPDGGADMVSEGDPLSDAFDDGDRRLCPDGACTGLLGADGKCKECGRSAAT